MTKSDMLVINEFVNTGLQKKNHRAHLLIDGFETLYMRISDRNLIHKGQRKVYRCLDIASVSVFEEHQRKGLFKSLLNFCEKICQTNGLALYIESVINEDLNRYLSNNNYHCDDIPLSPNFSKVFDKPEYEITLGV